MRSQFAFAACQPGAETALKREAAARVPEWRPAFSRPGFVTFKLPREHEVADFEPQRLTFARTIGLSLGRVDGEPSAADLAKSVWALPAVADLAAAGPLALHVWQRDSGLPGDNGVEPGPTAESLAARQALIDAAPDGALTRPDASSADRAKPAAALDVTIVEPTEWWIGAHTLRSRTDRWPGGVPRLDLPEHAVSRAYLKMQEALRWSRLPARAGDVWVELGCAPGGASQALLDAGMRVAGVDPAEVDARLLENERFVHVRARVAEAPRSELAPARWLAADINAAPDYTLGATEPLVAAPGSLVRGVLLTLKLLDPELAAPERVAEVVARVRGWGFRDIRVRQLAFNRREYCLAGLRSRAQRRVARRGRRTRPPRRTEGDG